MAGVHSITLDITEHRRQELRLRTLTTINRLTGLTNRAGFGERLLVAFDQTHTTRSVDALLPVDLDGSEVTDDTHGHAVDDALLQVSTQRLARAVRPCDDVARFGDDEFIIIPECLSHPDDAKAVAANTLSIRNRPLH